MNNIIIWLLVFIFDYEYYYWIKLQQLILSTMGHDGNIYLVLKISDDNIPNILKLYSKLKDKNIIDHTA